MPDKKWRLAMGLGSFALCVSCLCVAEEPTTVVRAQVLIDGASAQARRNQDIVIRGNRIVEVTPSGSHPLPQGVQLIDLGSATVLPGLIDTHTHIFHSWAVGLGTSRPCTTRRGHGHRGGDSLTQTR